MARHPRSSKTSTAIWGPHVVLEAFQSRYVEVESVCVSSEQRGRFSEILAWARKKGVVVREEGRTSLQKKANDAEQHQGVVAYVRFQPCFELDELLDKYSISLPTWGLVLDQIEDPRNLGAILRSAHFFGAGFVILPRDHAAPLNGTVAKASAGAMFSIPLAVVTNLARELERAEKLDFWRVGLDASAEKTLSKALPESRSTLLVLGSEGRGLRPLTAKRCDELARLSVMGCRDSLNVSVAAGVACHEVATQRTVSKAR